jgi:hypothetical protein
MNHYTLCFETEARAESVADRLNYLDDDGNLRSLGHDGALDVIGQAVISGSYDADGNELTPPVILPGYYVNLALPGPLPRALASFRVPYGSGGRIFAGTEPDPDPDAWPHGSGS